MATEQARRAHQIFTQALDLDRSGRDAFVHDRCAGDDRLRADVLRLLATADTVTTFLECPAIPGIKASAPLPPESIPGFRLIGVIGSGGMATVYEAEQAYPRRRVALKVMHRTLSHTSAAQRFMFEVEVLARLKHPGIAQFYEAGTCRDPAGHETPYFAMEFVGRARPLTAYARELPLRERLAVFAAICDAVQHGHQVGVIHRDLKPGNILVGEDGRPKVIDFGIARSVTPADDAITMHSDLGQLLGTLNYMSPEQCGGGGRIDTRTDVYALGVILYELVTGRTPHDLTGVSLPEALAAIQTRTPPRPRTHLPALDPDLDAVIMTAIARDPDDRYHGADALADDLRCYLDNRPVRARAPGAWRQARLFARRYRTLVALVAVSLTAITTLSAAIGVLGYLSWLESRKRIVAEHAAVEESRIARRQAYAASIASAFLSLRGQEVSRARERLDQTPPEMRGWEWDLVNSLSDSGERVLFTGHEMIFAMDRAHDADRILTVSASGVVQVLSSESGAVLARLEPSGPEDWPHASISRDGKHAVIGLDDGRVLRWDIDADTPPVPIAALNGPVNAVACVENGRVLVVSDNRLISALSIAGDNAECPTQSAPDRIDGLATSPLGNRFITWSRGGAVRVHETDTLAEIARFDFGLVPETACLNLDGSVAAAGGELGRIVSWRVDSGEVICENQTGPGISTTRALAINPSGTMLYAGQIDRSIRGWRLDGAKPSGGGGGEGAGGGLAWTRNRHDEAVSALMLDKEGRSMVSASWDGSVLAWPLGAGAGSAAFQIVTAHDGNALSLDFSPSGDLLASGGRDDVVKIWEPDLLIPLATLRGHRGDVAGVRFSPDGARVASASSDSTVRLWSTRTGAEELVLRPNADTEFWSVDFTPDGHRVAAAGESGTVTVWDAKTGSVLLEIPAHDHRIVHLRISPDGSTLATCSRRGMVTLWSLDTGRRVLALEGHEQDAFACRFSPDGDRLYTASRDQSMRVWNTATGEKLAQIPHRGQFLTSLTVSADGARVATGSWYSEVCIIDADTGDILLNFPAHNSAIRSVAFSPRGDLLVSAGHDGDLTCYDARAMDARVRARAEAAAGLDAARAALERSASPADPDDPGLTPEQRAWLRKAALLRANPPPPPAEA